MLRVTGRTQRQCLLIGLFSILMLVSCHALAEKRMALLIGNETYSLEIGRLANPHNDVALLESKLKEVGFDVVVVRDAGLGALTRAVNAHARRVQAAGPGTIGFLYYSGHGASDGSTNYLISVDVKTTETSAPVPVRSRIPWRSTRHRRLSAPTSAPRSRMTAQPLRRIQP
jgi:uncharacterized caspase-like protein